MSGATGVSLDFDPLSARDRRDPYPFYRELRDRAPVHHPPGSDVYYVSRHDDVMAVLKQPERFSSRAMFTMLMNGGRDEPPRLSPRVLWFIARMWLRTRMNPFEFATARHLIAEDGESHAQLRSVVNRGFTPRRIASWEPRIRTLVADCMRDLRDQPSFDVVQGLAVPVPVTVIAEMLGVGADRLADFKRWSDAIIRNISGPAREDPFNREFTGTILELMQYLKQVAAERQRDPRDDVLSAIVAEQEGAAGLSIREVVQFVMLLLIAGNETTTNLIGNAVKALLDHPDALAAVADDPGQIAGVVEETLRYDSPVQLVFRIATEDVEIAGVRIPSGSTVAPLIGSANRDERRFPDPDRFDPKRGTQGHLAFGFGQHFCLGASLARLEAALALEALVPELPRLRPVGPAGELVDSFLVRGPSRLELARVA